MFSISLVRIGPSVARVTGRQPAHFHILTDVLVDTAQLLAAAFLYLRARVRLSSCVCSQLRPYALTRTMAKVRFAEGMCGVATWGTIRK